MRPALMDRNIAPSLTQIADALLHHYGPRQVGAMTFDDPRDATMWRTIIAGRLLKAAHHDVRSAIACIEALSMDAVHGPETDAAGEPRIVLEPKWSAPGNRVTAWQENPVCVTCGETITDPRDAGALYGTLPLRVAHAFRQGQQSSCYIQGMLAMRKPERVGAIVPRALDRAGLHLRRVD